MSTSTATVSKVLHAPGSGGTTQHHGRADRNAVEKRRSPRVSGWVPQAAQNGRRRRDRRGENPPARASGTAPGAVRRAPLARRKTWARIRPTGTASESPAHRRLFTHIRASEPTSENNREQPGPIARPSARRPSRRRPSSRLPDRAVPYVETSSQASRAPPRPSLSVREWFWTGLIQDRPMAIALLSGLILSGAGGGGRRDLHARRRSSMMVQHAAGPEQQKVHFAAASCHMPPTRDSRTRGLNQVSPVPR